MPDGNRNLLDNVTPALDTALPVRIPGASGHTPAWDADRSPADRAAFAAASYVRIPTARYAPGMYTRETLAAAIKAEPNERVA